MGDLIKVTLYKIMIYAEILAGGTGTRMGNTGISKQFLKIGEKPIIIHTVEKFILQPRFDKILVVCNERFIAYLNEMLVRYIDENMLEKVEVCAGGSDRNESIMRGIEFIESNYGLNSEDIVVTHDAVRPFLTSRIINENIDMALEYGATDTVVGATDTIVQSCDNEFIENIPIRDNMYQGQTPQSFNIKKLKALYEGMNDKDKRVLSDAAKIFVANGEKVKLVDGENFNIKITTPYDLKIAEVLVESEDFSLI